MKRLKINVYGIVQGVGFRFFAQNNARKLGISGFVKNMPDGSVYIEGEGEESNLQEFVSKCSKGPSAALVENINTEEAELENSEGFSIL